MENELFSDGSKDEDIFGGDILFYPEVSVLWEAHPNFNRNMQLGIGKGRELIDTKLIDELFDILKEYISQERNKTPILNYWMQFDKAVV